MAGKFCLLIGSDTRSKHKYVRWEAEVAKEKHCIIIGVNLDKSRQMNADKMPPIIQNIGAIFVPFSPRIIAHALKTYEMFESGDRVYTPESYRQLGYPIT
jgi:hypothetical protein